VYANFTTGAYECEVYQKPRLAVNRGHRELYSHTAEDRVATSRFAALYSLEVTRRAPRKPGRVSQMVRPMASS
jgi:hypothetical protein